MFSKNRKICFAVLVSVLAIIVVLGLKGLFSKSNFMKLADAQARIRTKSDLINISMALERFSLATSHQTSNTNVYVNLTAESAYEMLVQTNLGVVFLNPRLEWQQKHMLLDRWGRPIRITNYISERGDSTVRYKVWSIGPDGIDNNGGGDDIEVKN